MAACRNQTLRSKPVGGTADMAGLAARSTSSPEVAARVCGIRLLSRRFFGLSQDAGPKPGGSQKWPTPHRQSRNQNLHGRIEGMAASRRFHFFASHTRKAACSTPTSPGSRYPSLCGMFPRRGQVKPSTSRKPPEIRLPRKPAKSSAGTFG